MRSPAVSRVQRPPTEPRGATSPARSASPRLPRATSTPDAPRSAEAIHPSQGRLDARCTTVTPLSHVTGTCPDDGPKPRLDHHDRGSEPGSGAYFGHERAAASDDRLR